MSIRRNTFGKPEKLCSKSVISGLIENGNLIHTPLLKVIWNTSPVLLPFPAQIAFSVSKRNFKLAVTRNLIKRRLREAYRRQKNTLYDFLAAEKKQLVMILIVRGNDVPDFSRVENAIADVMYKLLRALRVEEKQKKS